MLQPILGICSWGPFWVWATIFIAIFRLIWERSFCCRRSSQKCNFKSFFKTYFYINSAKFSDYNVEAFYKWRHHLSVGRRRVKYLEISDDTYTVELMWIIRSGKTWNFIYSSNKVRKTQNEHLIIVCGL